MQWHMLKLTFFFLCWHYKILELYYLRLFILRFPPLPPSPFESHDTIIPSFTSFFDGLPTCAKICHTSRNAPLDTTQTCIWFCVNPIVDACLLTCLITHVFHLSLAHLLIMLHTYIDLLDPIIAHLSRS